MKNETLCWNCINAVPSLKCGCSWSREFKPVQGWTAEEAEMRMGTYNEKTVTSYLVLKCPEFKKG